MATCMLSSSLLVTNSSQSRRINYSLIEEAKQVLLPAPLQPPWSSSGLHQPRHRSKRGYVLSRPDELLAKPSNRTSFIMDNDTNSTSAASVSDHRAIMRASGHEPASGEHWKYENISLTVDKPSTSLIGDVGGVVFDDDDDEGQGEAISDELGDQSEDEDDDYEDESDFYNSNPVDSIEFSLDAGDAGLGPKPPGSSTKQEQASRQVKSKSPSQKGDTTFDDFDDYQALKLDNFYDKPTKSVKKLAATIRRSNGRRKRPWRGRKKPFRHAKSKKSRRRRRRPNSKSQTGPDRSDANLVDSGRIGDGEAGGATKKKKYKEGVVEKGTAAATASGSQNHGTSESVNQYEGGDDNNSGNGDCALPLESGRCVTFESVEWAIRRARRLIRFAQPSRAALNSQEPDEATIHNTGELVEWTSRLLAIKWNLTPSEINDALEQIDVSQTSLWRACPRLYRQAPVARPCYGGSDNNNINNRLAPWTVGRFRTHTGQCNNPLAPHLGSSQMPFVRLTPPEYLDSIGSIRRSSLSGTQLPPARLVSLTLHPNLEPPQAGDHSALFFSWGQLVNHDLAMASGARVETGHDESCCTRSLIQSTTSASQQQWSDRLIGDPLNRVCLPILIGADDPVYGPHGIRCHDFKRSVAGLRPGCSLGPRTQLNLVTSFVDGSFVYGSARSVNAALRNGRRGQLSTWNYFRHQGLKPLLPPQLAQADQGCLGRPRGLYCFRSGDARTNQQVPLVVMHTVHTRQHNRIAVALAELNPHWPERRVYEEARHIHVAQIQHILLNEYLPLLLGEKLCRKFDLIESNLGEYWDHYEAASNPGISQEFAAAAFRQGHSSVPNNVYRFDVGSRLPRRFYPLRQLFRQPWPLFEPGAVDEFLLGLLETPSQSVDPFVSLELTGHLLEEPDEPVGLDLIAINIQRGRDQGVASYNSMRQWCGLERLNSFQELASVMSNASSQLMASLYETVDDIDLYSGGLSEFPLEGAQVGPTFACIIGHQFQTLRAADRYWFEASMGPQAFTLPQLDSIKQFTLARLICANSDAIGLIQASAMQLPHPIYNPLQSCASLPDLDLSLWIELQPPAQEEDEESDEAEDDDDR